MPKNVHNSEPPLSWLWDLYPLARDAWGNVLGFNDGSGVGHTIRMRMWLRAQPMSNSPLPAYRPARAPLPPMFQDGGVRDCYIPTEADKALVKRLFSDVADAGNPPWPQVEARLIVAEQDWGKLATYNAPTLLLLLDKAEHKTENRGSTELERTTPPAAGGEGQKSEGSGEADTDKEINELERKTPPLNRNSGKWVSNKRAAEIEGVETRTLADYRLQGIKDADGTIGRDKDGRVWRREGTPSSHPWYLRSTLRAK